MFGRKAKLPIDAMFESAIESGEERMTDEYIQDLKQRLDYAKKTVEEH